MTHKTVVYKYGTGNPVEPNGSGDVRDGIDNLQSFDVFMNAEEDTYNQRDGDVVQTVAGAIRSVGFKPGAGDFTTGFTVQPGQRDYAWYDPVSKNWYSYLGVIPSPSGYPVAPSTDPVGDVNWKPVTDWLLREELSSDEGDSYIGIGNERTQADKNSDVISVLDHGAIGNSTNGLDGFDSTAAFLSAIAECLTTKKSLSIPKQQGGYRLTAPVDVRQLNVLQGDATLYIGHAGIGIIFGGNASTPNNPSQSFGTIIRAVGTASTATPDMRGIGVKGQHIHVETCDYLQLYANDTPPNDALDYSCAYSTLVLKKVDLVQLFGEGGGWINENIFHLNRTHKILFVDGAYQHNHNKFYQGTMEGPGIIDMPIGSNNYFYGMRFERGAAVPADTLDINFGANTWNNVIEATWLSSPQYTNEPYNPANQVTITDLGYGNAVYHAQDTASDEVTLFSLSDATPFVSSANETLAGTLTKNTDMHGVRYIQHLVSGKFKCTHNFATAFMDDRKIPVRNGDMFMVYSDAAIFRPVVFLYDNAGNLIQTEPSDPEIIKMSGKVWNADGYFTIGTNSARIPIMVGAGVSAVRIQVNTGSSSVGQMFEFMRVTARFYKDATKGNRKSFNVNNAIRKSAMSYFSSSDISMANISEGLPCYKNDMTEMRVNLLRQRYLVKSISGNVITVAGATVQYFELPSCFVVYSTATDNLMVSVSAVSGATITLTAPVPADIVAGSNIDFIVTKTKVLA